MLNAFLHRLERSWLRLLWSAVFGAVLAAGVSLAFPWQYSSSMRLLVVQANVAGLDPYTALKSTEQIAFNVRELVYTSLVANRVLSETTDLDTGFFSQDEYRRRKEWQEAVEVGVAPGTGILTVTVYHPDREQARLLVQGVAKQIIEKTPSFGYNAQAQIIDTPLPSRWIARPDLLLAGLYGAIIGLFLAILWVFLSLDDRRRAD